MLKLGLGAILTTGCQSQAEEVVRIGFDDIHGWGPQDPPWLTDSTAHSGRWSYSLSIADDYGPNFSRSWAELNNPKTIRVGAWVWLPHGRITTALAINVERDGEKIYYKSMGFREVVKRYRSWELVHQTHELPADMRPTDMVNVYIWQWGEHHRMKCDDMFVEKLR
ncbi:hypothetical protein LGH70_20650 [Hymenobacter sp. BT635]|uniref:Uncharacterized protein n=1 Tax=Hymenobacter nitidus TaxID=2880929 RepID=A0ABS8AJF4_9BACT|nr:hypothetical protein [Hymenobacter nitidus]MCB2380016.1 hypothetical protein [Hymenobacter nitidus]